MNKYLGFQYFLISIVCFGMIGRYGTVLGHGKHELHDDDGREKNNLDQEVPSKRGETLQKEIVKVLEEINQKYQKTVKPIFAEKCFNCHTSKTVYPWYYSIPGVKQLIDHDIKDARRHLDMENDFPFKGHGSVDEDLDELKEVIEEGSMPPLLYLIMHPSHKINDQEKEKILEWVDDAQKKLGISDQPLEK